MVHISDRKNSVGLGENQVFKVRSTIPASL
jgi:hypothetical protein